MRHSGRCHCGNLILEFDTRLGLGELPLRACQCSFCRGHGVLSTSDPAGSVDIHVVDGTAVQRYRFGLGITDFLICRRCGVYLLALAEMDGGRYAVLNAKTLDGRAGLSAESQAMDYTGEDAAARRLRRKARWTPVGRLDGFLR